MKKVECIIRPAYVDSVRNALESIGVNGMTVTHVSGYGKQKGQVEYYRGIEYTPTLLPKVKVEVVVADAQAQKVVDAVIGAARTEKVGDGKIFIYDIADSIRIRTGETGEASL